MRKETKEIMKLRTQLAIVQNERELVRMMFGQFKAGFIDKETFLKSIERVMINTSCMLDG